MFTFPATSITVVRKKGDEYIQESINTEPVLTGSKLSPEDNRKNVIARLRQDPTVFLVMEPRNGCCEEFKPYVGIVRARKQHFLYLTAGCGYDGEPADIRRLARKQREYLLYIHHVYAHILPP